MALTPGTRLGPYEIVAPLGAGGMGEVYRARDTRLGREVAIKVLAQHLTASPEDRARFKREAKTISSLNHPHICVLHDVGQQGDIDYLVMELVVGETLAQRIVRGALPSTEVLRLGVQIADALDRAHRAGAIHRDLKPGNVMLTKGGVKLMDFGLARSAGRPARGADDVTATAPAGASKSEDPITAKGTVVGTFQYMAPEQLEGKGADARSDIWALGCVLYEMATAKRAFEGSTPVSLISAIMRDQPRVMAELAPLSPPALERVVRACLEKDADERIQTTHDLKLQLQWISEAGSHAGVAAPIAARRRSRERAAWALVGVLTIVTTVLSLLSWRTRPGEAGHYAFTPLTFKPMVIFKAAFAPDGKTVVLSAATDGQTPRVFVMRPEYPEPQPISEPGTHLLSVSSQGELAVLTKVRTPYGGDRFEGTLARMPLGGGAPREILEKVREADWSPDGSQLAVLRDIDGRDRIEFPIGTVLSGAGGYISDLRVSPSGDRVAFFEHESRLHFGGSISIVDLHGRKAVLSSGHSDESGIAWSRDGKSLFFSARDSVQKNVSIFAVALTGKRRHGIGSAGGLRIQDTSQGGRLLAIRDDEQCALMVHRPGWSEDRDLSWLDSSVGGQLSGDGSVVAFTEYSNAVGDHFASCLRRTDGSAVVRLGEGRVWDLSEDGKRALVFVPSDPPQLVVQSTGAGGVIRLSRGTIESYNYGGFFPGSDSVLLIANEAGKAERHFVQDLTGRPPRAVTPEGSVFCAISPDGKAVMALGLDRRWNVYPLDGGSPRPVPTLTDHDLVYRWNPDGRTVLAIDTDDRSGPIQRVNLATGFRTPFLTVTPANLKNLVGWDVTDFTPDNQTYVYNAWWRTSTLFAVEAVR